MIGTQEMILIALVIILLFGADKIPELARSLGKASGEFNRTKKDIEKELKEGENLIKEEMTQVEKSIANAKAHNEDKENKPSKIRQMAIEIGIDPKGKSDEQLLDEIREKAISANVIKKQ